MLRADRDRVDDCLELRLLRPRCRKRQPGVDHDRPTVHVDDPDPVDLARAEGVPDVAVRRVPEHELATVALGEVDAGRHQDVHVPGRVAGERSSAAVGSRGARCPIRQRWRSPGPGPTTSESARPPRPPCPGTTRPRRPPADQRHGKVLTCRRRQATDRKRDRRHVRPQVPCRRSAVSHPVGRSIENVIGIPPAEYEADRSGPRGDAADGRVRAARPG